MTIRAKVLLVVSLAVTLVLAMGLGFYASAERSRAYRNHLLVIQGQTDSLNRLQGAVLSYLPAMLRARREGSDTRAVLARMQERLDVEAARLRQSLVEEARFGQEAGHPGEAEELERLLQRMNAWAVSAEETVRSAEPGAPLVLAKWRLLEEFQRGVGQHIQEALHAEYRERNSLLQRWDARLLEVERLALLVPSVSLLVMVGLALVILRPMHRALRELQAGVARIGRGDFEHTLEAASQDELGALAHAFNRMAGELRDSLREKQRLMRAEAAAAEREFQRYNALLEQTVQTRTAELEAANARLSDSLQQLRATQMQLQFSERLASVGQLAAGVAHEINNPLSYVISNLGFLHGGLRQEQGAPPPGEREEWLEALAEAREGAERMRLIVSDLKMLSRPDDTSTGPVELGAVVRSAAKMAGHEIRHRARLVLACEDAPPVQANAARLCQVFLNLLVNAAHAIAPGRVEENEIRVESRLEEPGRVTVEVRDTGCGIPPESLARIFEPFFTTKAVGEGTGLGLSVSQGIISALGGELRVESEPGRGTRFFVRLPLAGARGEAPAAEA